MTPFILILALVGADGSIAQIESAGAFPSGFDCAWGGIKATEIAEVDEKRAPKAGVRFVCVPTNIDASEAELDVIHAETEAERARAMRELREAIRSRREAAGMAEAAGRAAARTDAELAAREASLLAEQAAARERLRAELRPIIRENRRRFEAGER